LRNKITSFGNEVMSGSKEHTINMSEMNIEQAYNYLLTSSSGLKTAQFTFRFEENCLELTETESSEKAESFLVLFANNSWSTVNQLTQKMSECELSPLHMALIKPTDNLPSAVKLTFTTKLCAENRVVLQSWAESEGCELAYVNQGPSLNSPGLLVMDMDSTAIQIECIDEIAVLAGVGEQVAEVTAAAMRGELDFAESLRARVATLKGAPVEIIDKVANNLPLMPGLIELVEQLKAANWKVVIASGGFTYMTDVLKNQLGLDRTVANQLDMSDGMLTGNVLGKIVDANVKAETVEALADEWNIPMSQTVAIGDGANDLVMMAKANLGVAFHAKPLVREKADTSIREGSLEQLLYLL
jgi:phosphoserine phosphatase